MPEIIQNNAVKSDQWHKKNLYKIQISSNMHGTIIRTGTTCKKIPCYMCESAFRWCIVKNAKIFWSYVKHFLCVWEIVESWLVYANKFLWIIQRISWLGQ